MNVFPSGIPNIGNDPAFAALDAKSGVQYASASGAITITQGTVAITAGSAAALTLAVPVSGLPSAGGNDGQELNIIDTGGHAHTVTTPSNGISPSHHVATFGGTAGSNLALVAIGGVWYPLNTSLGITFS